MASLQAAPAGTGRGPPGVNTTLQAAARTSDAAARARGESVWDSALSRDLEDVRLSCLADSGLSFFSSGLRS